MAKHHNMIYTCSESKNEIPFSEMLNVIVLTSNEDEIVVRTKPNTQRIRIRVMIIEITYSRRVSE